MLEIIRTQQMESEFRQVTLAFIQQAIMLERTHILLVPIHILLVPIHIPLVQVALLHIQETHTLLGITLAISITQAIVSSPSPHITLPPTRLGITLVMDIIIIPLEQRMAHTQRMDLGVLVIIMELLIQAKTIMLAMGLITTHRGNHMPHTQQVDHIR
jgi:hypothetical protein